MTDNTNTKTDKKKIKLDKRAQALRDNLKKRKPMVKKDTTKK